MKRQWLIALGACIITAAIFSPVVMHQFVGWDDPSTIQANPFLHPPTWESLVHYWTNEADGLYVPVTYTVWWTLAAVTGRAQGDGSVLLSPAIFHAASLLVHILSVALVFNLFRKIVGRDWPAFVGAMVFAIHPLQVETVAWASGLKDLLCGFFSLLAITFDWRYETEDHPKRFAVGTWIAFLLAMLSKPVGMMLPLMLGMMAVGMHHRTLREVLRKILPMLLAALPVLIITRSIQTVAEGTYTPLWTRPLIAMDSLAFYLWKLVWPVQLSPIYPRPPQVAVSKGWIYYTWILPAAVAAILFCLRKSWRTLSVAGMLFVIALLPVLGLTRFMFQKHSTVADHYLYLPMFAVALAASFMVARVPAKAGNTCSVIVILLLLMGTLFQLPVWKESVSLFMRAAEVSPANPGAQADLGRALAIEGRLDEAIERFAISVKLAPGDREEQISLAQALLVRNRFEEAITHARAALQIDQNDPNSGIDTSREESILGQALVATNQLQLAEPHLAAAARQRPDDPAMLGRWNSIRNRLRNANPATTQQ